MMNKLSIKTRITLWYTLIILVISMAALFLMVSVSQEILIRDSADRLTASVERLIPAVSRPREASPKAIEPKTDLPQENNISYHTPNDKPDTAAQNEDFRRFPGFMFFENGVHTAVYDQNGEIAGGAIPFEFADEIELKDGELLKKTYDSNQFLTYSKKVLSEDSTAHWIVGVVSIANEGTLLSSVTKTNLILIAILILVAALGGYLILKQAFKPVETIRNTAKSISESRDLSQRIALCGGKDEIYRLAETFDEMLAKIEKTLNKEKQFTSDASHELRTPVAVISSECEYTLECAATLDEAKESVMSIKQQTDKMSRLISELLEISRMDKNTMEVNLESIDISELLNFVCDEQEEIHTGNITLKRSIAPNVYIATDSMLSARIFINLISNAYSYGKENGNIDVALLDGENEVVVEIADDGIGIAEEKLPRIWERFYQVNTSRTNADGNMGLGLSMVKLIADRLGIGISVKSKLGEGTTFTLVMPKNRI